MRDMHSGRSTKVRRLAVQDPVAADRCHDYADAFVIDLPAPAAAPPATWLGTGLSRVPRVVHWIADCLGHLVVDLPSLLATSLRLEPVGGMTVPRSGPGVPGLDPQEQR